MPFQMQINVSQKHLRAARIAALRQPRGFSHLGVIATELLDAVRTTHELHEDVDAFNAPSECHAVVAKGVAKRYLKLAEDLEQATGYHVEELINEFLGRCSGKWLHFNGILEPLQVALEIREQMETDRLRVKYGLRAKLPVGCSGEEIAIKQQRREQAAIRRASLRVVA